MPGSCRARAPVASTMWADFSMATGLPSFSTASVCLPASLAEPSNTVILFLRIKCATPEDNCLAMARERFTTLSISKRDSTGAKPKSGRWCSRWLISDVRSSALVGMQPQLRHMPPSWSRSTMAVFMPSCAARMAATYPPGPPPTMTMSKFWSAIRGSFGECGQCVAGEMLRYPAGHRFGADAAVEVDCGLVPVEDVPDHVDAVALLRDARHVTEQGEADAAAAERVLDEDVFNEQACAAGEGAEGEIPEGEACHGAIDVDEDGFERRAGREQRGVEFRFGDAEAMLEVFVRREVAHQAMERGDVGGGGGAEIKHGLSESRHA